MAQIQCIVNAINEGNHTAIQDQTIDSKDFVLSSSAGHAENKGLGFDDCVMNGFPSSDAIKNFKPNLEILTIDRCTLSKITADDLKGFECLKVLSVQECGIEYLPGDLFKHTPQLEQVSFAHNNIKYIGEEILEPLQNLKRFDVSNNVNIHAYYYDSSKVARFSTTQARNCNKVQASTS